MNNLNPARAAEAMLRALGGESVSLLFPVATAAPDLNDELGLAVAAMEEVAFAPVVVRALVPDNGHARRELLFAASAIRAQVDARPSPTPEALFQSAVGVLHQGRLLRIASVTPELFAGEAYLYRVLAVE